MSTPTLTLTPSLRLRLRLGLTDSATMLRRNLRHALRYPAMTASTILVPMIILLLFVGVLGNTLRAGLGARAAGGGGGYIGYLTPGIILISVAASCVATSVAVCVDVTGGIVDRFRTMPIARSAVLTGHVLGSVIQTAASLVVVTVAAVLIGFRPAGAPVRWLAAAGLLLLLAFALTWLSVLIGLTARNPESASNTPLLVQLLPFVSSAFVPTDALPGGIRWFAEYQPFTELIEATRALLLGTPVGHHAVAAVAWCVAIALTGYLGSRAVFGRPRAA